MIARVLRAAALLHPRALAARARAHVRLPELMRQVETLTGEVQSLSSALDAVSLRERQLRAVLQADAAADDRVLRFQATLDEEALAHHIQKVVRRATLHLDPFHYCIVDHLFPRSYYNALIAAIPPVTSY